MLIRFLKQGYHFQPFSEFLVSPKNKVVVMRHDIDRLPKNALLMAKLESKLDINQLNVEPVILEVLLPKEKEYLLNLKKKNLKKFKKVLGKTVAQKKKYLESLREKEPQKFDEIMQKVRKKI